MSEKYTEEELDKASDFGRPNIHSFPFIKFSAAEGGKSEVKHFTLLTSDADGNLQAQDLGEELKVVILHRGKFKMKKGNFSTNELTPNKDKQVSVYKRTKTGKRVFENKGTWHEMKEKYGMSTSQIPYVLVDQEGFQGVAKLGVLPSSLSNYWEYCDEFKRKEKPRHFETIVKASDKEKESQGGTYYEMSFKRGKALDEELREMVEEDIMDLDAKLKENEKAFSQDEDPETEEEVFYEKPEVDKDDIPVIDENADPALDDVPKDTEPQV